MVKHQHKILSLFLCAALLVTALMCGTISAFASAGDTVYVNAGNDKGKTGKVLEVIRDKDRVVVEGVNMISKHTKPNAKYPQGGIIKQEAGIHISNVQLLDPTTSKPVKVGYRFEDGKKIRYSKKSGEEIK